MYTQFEKALRDVMLIQARELQKRLPVDEIPTDLNKATDDLVRSVLQEKDKREALGKAFYDSGALMSLQGGVLRLEFDDTEQVSKIYDAVEELMVSSLKVYQNGTV